MSHKIVLLNTLARVEFKQHSKIAERYFDAFSASEKDYNTPIHAPSFLLAEMKYLIWLHENSISSGEINSDESFVQRIISCKMGLIMIRLLLQQSYFIGLLTALLWYYSLLPLAWLKVNICLWHFNLFILPATCRYGINAEHK